MATNNDKDHVMLELEPAVNRSRRHRSTSRERRDINLSSDVEPLYEPDVSTIPYNPRNKPPIAGPETDLDDEEDEQKDNVPFTPEARPGVDDGFFPPNVTPSNIPNRPSDRPINRTKPGDDNNNPNGFFPRRDDDDNFNNGRRPSRNFPYAPDFGPGVIMINGIPTQIPDLNVYQQKKTLASGMMDIALLSANANQLRYVLESYRRHPYYYVSLAFISISLILQIAVGIGLILNSRYNVKDQREICKANRINNFTVIGIFIVTLVNVFVSAFGVADPPPDMNA